MAKTNTTGINIPNNLYFNLRSGLGRLDIKDNNYQINNIKLEKLYCIIKDDLLFNDESFNNAIFRINHNGYIRLINSSDEIIKINASNLKLDYNSYYDIKDKYIELNLGNTENDRIINIHKLLSEGLIIPLKMKNSYNFKEQLIKLNVNILDLVLNNIYIKQINNEYLIQLIGSQYILNESDYDNNDYYDMNHYIIKNTINNNEIEYIKFIIPYYVIMSLLDHSYMIMTLYFYTKNENFVNIDIKFNLSNNKLNVELLNNNILYIENSSFFIDYENKENNFIILKNIISGNVLPKFLSLKINFSFCDDNKYKICYVVDTNKIPSNGGELIYLEDTKESDSIRLFYNKTKKIYDIFYVGVGNEDEDNITNILNPKEEQNGIIVNSLILSEDFNYNYSNTNVLEGDNDSFNIYLKNPKDPDLQTDDDNNSYTKINNFNYPIQSYFYFNEPNILNEENDDIFILFNNEGEYQKYTNYTTDLDKKTPYQLRFNKISISLKNNENDENENNQVVQIWKNTLYSTNNNLRINNISNEIENNFNIKINNEEIDNKNILEKIEFRDQETKEKIKKLVYGDNIGLYLSKYFLNDGNIINDLYLKRDISFNYFEWQGFIYNDYNVYNNIIFIKTEYDNVDINKIITSPIIINNVKNQLNFIEFSSIDKDGSGITDIDDFLDTHISTIPQNLLVIFDEGHYKTLYYSIKKIIEDNENNVGSFDSIKFQDLYIINPDNYLKNYYQQLYPESNENYFILEDANINVFYFNNIDISNNECYCYYKINNGEYNEIIGNTVDIDCNEILDKFDIYIQCKTTFINQEIYLNSQNINIDCTTNNEFNSYQYLDNGSDKIIRFNNLNNYIDKEINYIFEITITDTNNIINNDLEVTLNVNFDIDSKEFITEKWVKWEEGNTYENLIDNNEINSINTPTNGGWLDTYLILSPPPKNNPTIEDNPVYKLQLISEINNTAIYQLGYEGYQTIDQPNNITPNYNRDGYVSDPPKLNLI